MLHRNLITPTEVFIAPTKIAVGAVIDVVMRSFSEHVDESILEISMSLMHSLMYPYMLTRLCFSADLGDGWYSTKLTQHIPSKWMSCGSLHVPSWSRRTYK